MKTNLYCFLILFLLPVTPLVAQSRFALSVTGGPVLNHASTRYTYLLPDGNGQTTSGTSDNRVNTHGYAIGISVGYTLTPQGSISTGFWYNRLSRDDSNPFAPSITPTPARIIHQDFQVPLLLNYRFTRKTLSPYVSVGALVNFRRNTIIRDESFSGQDDIKLLSGKSMDVRAVVGAGISYQINSKWTFIAQPLLIWRFPSASAGQTIDRYIVYQVNGQFQVMYRF